MECQFNEYFKKIKALKKILIFIDWFEPGYKGGGPIRSIAGFVDNFNENFELDIVTRDRDFNSEKTYDNIETNIWCNDSKNVRLMFLSPEWTLSKIIKIFNKTEYDWVYLNSFFSVKYSILPNLIFKFSKNYNGKVLLAPRGELNPERLNIKPIRKKVFITLVKVFNLYNNVSWHCTSIVEKRNTLNLFSNSDVLLASNLSKKASVNINRAKETSSLKIIFISRIINYKNLDYAIEVVNKMKSIDKVLFHFYGPIEDENYYHKCLDLAKKSKFDIIYKGELKHFEVSRVFLSYDVFLFPTLGENYGHVIAEALISGCAVITSDQTPWGDLNLFDSGWAISLEDKEIFTEKLEELYKMSTENFKLKKNSIYNYTKMKINNRDTISSYLDFLS